MREKTAGERGSQVVLPQDTEPTRVQTPERSHTRGPPESPCGKHTFEIEQQQHWNSNVFLLLSSYTWQDEEPEAPAQIMASVILLWPQICVHTAGLMMGTPVCCRIWGLAKKREKKSWHITLHSKQKAFILFLFYSWLTRGGRFTPASGEAAGSRQDVDGWWSQTYRRDTGSKCDWRSKFQQSNVIVEGCPAVERMGDYLHIQKQ